MILNIIVRVGQPCKLRLLKNVGIVVRSDRYTVSVRITLTNYSFGGAAPPGWMQARLPESSDILAARWPLTDPRSQLRKIWGYSKLVAKRYHCREAQLRIINLGTYSDLAAGWSCDFYKPSALSWR